MVRHPHRRVRRSSDLVRLGLRQRYHEHRCPAPKRRWTLSWIGWVNLGLEVSADARTDVKRNDRGVGRPLHAHPVAA
jgi:hypothetical protein